MRVVAKLVLWCVLAAGWQLSYAADRTWTGLGANSLFTTPGNWLGGLVPGAGDRAIFPVGPTNKIVTFGTPITLQAVVMDDCGYQLGQFTTAQLTLTTAAAVNVTCDVNAGVNIIGGNPVAMTAGSPTITQQTTGGVPGANTTLQIGVTNGVEFSGTLTIDVDQTTSGREPRVQTRLIETAFGSVTKIGDGTLLFGSANTYNGLTRVNDGILQISDDAALGSAINGTIVTGPGELFLNAPSSLDTGIESMQLVHNTTAPLVSVLGNVRWGGAITMLGTAPIATRMGRFELRNSPLLVAGVLSGNANLRIEGTIGTGTFELAAPATYTGSTEVFANARFQVNSASNRIPDTTDIILSGGEFSFLTTGPNSDDVASLRGNGTVALFSSTTLRLIGNADYALTAGTLTGAGNLIKLGTGTFTLGATSTLSGQLSVRDGELQLGSNANTTLTVAESTGILSTDAAASTGAYTGGSATTAELRPGGTGFGILSTRGFVAGGQVRTVLDFAGNSPGINQDQISLPTPADTMNLSGPVTFNASTPLAPGSSAVLINNAGADAIAGIFVGVPEGNVRNIGGVFYRLSYLGGDGNDFTVTRPAALAITTTSPLPDATRGIPYGGSILASGGFPPYGFLVTGGALPSGVSLNSAGAFSGAPSATGVFNFTVEVTDAAAATANRSFQLTVNAPVFTWDGGSSSDSNWTSSLNWVGDVAPVTGVDAALVFPSAAARKSNSNNFGAPAAFGRLEVAEGYTLGGNPVVLSDPVAAVRFRTPTAGTNTSRINNILTLLGANTAIDFLAEQASGNFTAIVGSVAGPINFQGTLTLLVGRVSGAVNAQLWIENLVESTPGSGLRVQRQSPATLGSTLDIVGPNTYSGPTQFLDGTVNLLRVGAALGSGDGTAATGTEVRDAVLISQVPASTTRTFANERLVLLDDALVAGVPILRHFSNPGPTAGSTVWSGPIVLAPDSSALPRLSVLSGGLLRINGAITGTAQSLIIEPASGTGNSVEFANAANSYLGQTWILPNIGLRLLSPEVIPNSSELRADGTLFMNGVVETIANLIGGGSVNIEGLSSDLRVNVASSVIYPGTLTDSGAGGRLTKLGAGTLFMSGPRTHTGSEVVAAGIYNIAASTTGQVRVGNGTLSGDGSIGTLINDLPGSTGIIQPVTGQSISSTGITIGGSLNFNPQFFGGTVTPLVATGAVVISGTANLNMCTNAVYAINSSIVLINNDLSDAVSGTFNGLPNQSYFTTCGTVPQSFRIQYNGGDGNDVMVQRSVPVDITTTSLPAGTSGTFYSQILGVTGGVPPYIFGLSSGLLPTGLTLISDGTISGTPTAVGTFNFDVTVTDSVGGTDVQSFALVINTSDATWDGGGSDNNWSTPANWVGDIAPVPGSSAKLLFPGIAARKTNVNDFPANSFFGGIRIVGPNYAITGNSVFLTALDGLVYVAVPTVALDSELDLDITLLNPTILATYSFVPVPRGGPLPPRNALRLNSLPSTRAIRVNAPTLSLTLNDNGFGSGGPDLVVGRVRFGGGYGGNIFVDGSPGRVELFDSNHSGTIVIQNGTLRATAVLSFGSGDGTASSGVEVQSGANLELAANLAVPLLERIFLHNNSGSARPVLSLGNNSQTSGEVSLGGDAEVRVAVGPLPPRMSGPITGNSALTLVSLAPNAELRIENPGNSWLGALLVGPGLTLATTGAERIPDAVDVAVAPAGRLRLGGTGVETIGLLDVAGTLEPGTIRLLSQDVLLASPAAFVAVLNGTTPGTNQSQLSVTGALDLTDATLTGTSAGVAPGSVLTLIDNDGSDPVAGTFLGLPENTAVTLSASSFRVRYAAGSGNDVLLYRADALVITTLTLPDGQLGGAYGPVPVLASGGFGASTFAATGLPNGLTINPGTGVITGTPLVSGPFTVDVTVTDGLPAPANTAVRSFSLTIAAAQVTSSALLNIAPVDFVQFPAGFNPTARVSGTSARPAGSLTLTAALAPGFVTVVQCVASISNGPGAFEITGSCPLVPSSPGVWRVTAAFVGAPGFASSNSLGVDYTVRTTSSFGSIVQSAPTTVVGEPFTVTVTLAGAGTFPTGTVSVLPIPVGNLANCVLTPQPTPNTSACTATVISPAAVAKLLRVTYRGSGEPIPVFLPFQAPTQQAHNTERANTESRIVAAGPDPAQIGQAVEVRYAVNVRQPGAVTALAPLNGQVEVTDGVDRCSGPLTPGGATSSGVCSVVLTTLGLRQLTVRYLGNENYTGSASQPEAQTVVGAGSGSDLSITLGNGRSTLSVGAPVQYRLRALNSGPVASVNARVQMAVPNGLTGMTWTCQATPPSICAASGAGAINQLITLGQPAAVPSMVEFLVSGNAPAVEGIITASASIAPPTGSSDPVLNNNSASDTDTVGVFGTGFESDETE